MKSGIHVYRRIHPDNPEKRLKVRAMDLKHIQKALEDYAREDIEKVVKVDQGFFLIFFDQDIDEDEFYSDIWKRIHRGTSVEGHEGGEILSKEGHFLRIEYSTLDKVKKQKRKSKTRSTPKKTKKKSKRK